MSAIGQSVGGPPAVKFTNAGDSHWGTILEIRDIQARDFKSKEPLFYPDGSKVLQTVLTIQKPDGELARLFVKAGAMRTACATAVRAANAEDVSLGGKIRVTYIGDEPATNGGTRKAYTAQYKIPDPNWVPPAPPAPARPEPVVDSFNVDDEFNDEPPF